MEDFRSYLSQLFTSGLSLRQALNAHRLRNPSSITETVIIKAEVENVNMFIIFFFSFYSVLARRKESCRCYKEDTASARSSGKNTHINAQLL